MESSEDLDDTLLYGFTASAPQHETANRTCKKAAGPPCIIGRVAIRGVDERTLCGLSAAFP